MKKTSITMEKNLGSIYLCTEDAEMESTLAYFDGVTGLLILLSIICALLIVSYLTNVVSENSTLCEKHSMG